LIIRRKLKDKNNFIKVIEKDEGKPIKKKAK
jgi:hypothetical protein